MLQGFKGFLMRGNVIDLAVAVVIGAAFGALVASLVALISFVSVAAAIYFFVVVPIERSKGPAQVETRACPERTSEIPLAARRCSQSKAQVSPAG